MSEREADRPLDPETELTRRRLIGGAAVGAAGVALPGAAEAASRRRRRRPRRRRADVVVVGAGFAGLTAARELVRRGKSVVVLEARPRVGGRTLNASIPGGETVEIGGQWVGPTQDRMFALAKELSVETYRTYNEGDNLYYRNGMLTPFSSSGPFGPVPPDPSGVGDAAKIIAQLNDMANGIPRDEPYKAERAVEYDGQTFETFKQNNTTTDSGRFLIDVGIQSIFSAEPRDISLLWVLFYIAAAGNESTPGTFERLINVAGGAQESRFVGGSQLLALRMARALGRRVVLGAPVRRIVSRRGAARVDTDKLSVLAKRVIVAVPPTLAGRIEYDPILPALRDQLTQRVPMGTVTKVMAVYDKPFWREEGLTGQAVSDTGPCRITFDNTPPDGSPGVLLGFVEAQEGRAFGPLPAAERRRLVLESFARYYGERASRPIGYVEMNWATEQFSRGCYGGFFPPGVLLDYGVALREPVGRIHWAGTETSPIWNGYMEGAVRSGERAAREVLPHV